MKNIKVGVFGMRRGNAHLQNLMLCGAEIVAVCDKDTAHMEKTMASLNFRPAVYTDFDEFIEHGMDAVVLANYFHEHAAYAIRCLERGIHVLSECTAAGTMAECVALVRAAERSRAVYMLAENYPYMVINQEMRRVFRGGTLGKLLYAEGEYNHPLNPDYGDGTAQREVWPFPKHWRNTIPATYYITHSMAPLMYITGAMPKRVTAMPIFYPIANEEYRYDSRTFGERAAIITTLNDDDSVYRVTGTAEFGGHNNSYRICGSRGQIENLRGFGTKLMLRYNDWQIPEGMQEMNCYSPEWPANKKEFIEKAGHGGGDYFVAEEFMRCIREGVPPEFDVYFAVILSSTAILAYRSMMQFGVPFDIPDFRKEEDRMLYENDHDTPFWGTDGSAPTVPSGTRPDYRPDPVKYQNYLTKIGEA